VNQLIDLANALGVDPSSVEQQAQSEMTEEERIESLSDEALLMADELLKKHYPLPDLISEGSIRVAHLGLKAYERALK